MFKTFRLLPGGIQPREALGHALLALALGTLPAHAAGSGTSYGDASSVVLREVERGPRHVVLELRTGGFLATLAERGRVRLHVPGFEKREPAGRAESPDAASYGGGGGGEEGCGWLGCSPRTSCASRGFDR